MKITLKLLWAALRIVLMLAIVLVFVLGGAFIAFGRAKDIHINKYWIDYAIAKFAPDDIKIQADAFDLHLIGEGFWQKRISLAIKDSCISYQDPAVHVCFSNFEWQVSANYKGFKPSIVYLGPIRFEDVEVAVDTEAFKPSAEPSKPSDFSILDFVRKDLMPHWKFAGTQINIKSAHIKTGDSLYGFKAFVGANDNEVHVIIPDARDLKSSHMKADAALLAYIPGDLTTSNKQPWHLQLGGNVTATGKTANLDIESDIRAFDDLTYDLKAKIHNISLLREAKLKGTYKGDDVKGVVSVQLGGYGAQIKQVNFVDCGYDANLDKKVAALQCGPQAILLSLAQNAAFKHTPALFALKPTLLLKFSDISFKQGIKGKADVKVDLDHMGLMDFHFHAAGDYDGSGKKTKYSAKLEAGADVMKFKKIVALLRTTPFAVPAPLNVMKGHINFGMHGEMDQDGGEFPFELTPDLRSETQRLLLTVGGKVKLRPEEAGMHTKVEIDTQVQDISLAAPRLDLAMLPQLQPDSRFATPTPTPKPLSAADARKKQRENEKSKAAAAAEAAKAQAAGVGDAPLNGKPSPTPSSFSYKARIHTTEPGAIKLQTNLTKNSIPISIDLTGTSHKEAIVGSVDIGQTAIELFHRKAEVNDILLKLRPDGTQEVNAKLTIRYLDYTIFVYAEGGTSDPTIKLESDPPLEQADIISVLLYGRTADDLDPAQSQSVSTTNSAIADKAIGIASLFLLASTPIESVAYNSADHSVTARIGLGHGTSLDVGSGSQVVGVRHRLGKNWILSSYVEKDQVTQENAVDAFVEWVRLF